VRPPNGAHPTVAKRVGPHRHGSVDAGGKHVAVRFRLDAQRASAARYLSHEGIGRRLGQRHITPVRALRRLSDHPDTRPSVSDRPGYVHLARGQLNIPTTAARAPPRFA
jgi:hypothetical protein